MTVSKVLSFCLLIILAGCASPGTVQTDYDRFTNTTINHTGGVFLPREMGENFQVVLNLCQKVPSGGTPSYYLVLRSIALLASEPGSHLYPDPLKPSLYVLADGHRVSTSFDDNQGDRYWYPIQRSDAKVIANADKIEIHVIRSDGTYWERELTPQGLVIFHQFASRFLQ